MLHSYMYVDMHVSITTHSAHGRRCRRHRRWTHAPNVGRQLSGTHFHVRYKCVRRSLLALRLCAHSSPEEHAAAASASAC